MERGERKGNERREGRRRRRRRGTSRAKSKFFFSLSLFFFGSVSTFNLSDDNGVTDDIANRRKTTSGRGTESLIKIH